MRVGWAEGDHDWLAAVARPDSILASRDTAVVAAMAPETDAETAAALASLPKEYMAALALGMALGGEGEDRLLIASDPKDGAVCVFALCCLDGGACALRSLAAEPAEREAAQDLPRTIDNSLHMLRQMQR